MKEVICSIFSRRDGSFVLFLGFRIGGFRASFTSVTKSRAYSQSNQTICTKTATARLLLPL